MLDLDGIEAFVTIAEAGSISETARRLALSKSVVSGERLANLERALGARLRVNNGLLMRGAVLAGLGIALLPSFLIGAELAAGLLRIIDVGMETDVACPKDRAPSATVLALTQRLRNAGYARAAAPPRFDVRLRSRIRTTPARPTPTRISVAGSSTRLAPSALMKTCIAAGGRPTTVWLANAWFSKYTVISCSTPSSGAC